MRTALFLLCFFACKLNAQEGQAAAPRFPEDWTGVWSGDLNIWNGPERSATIPMSVEILPIDTSKTGRYTFGLMYMSKAKDWRPYELVAVDKEKGIWRIDEKNSIVMESYLFGTKFMCWFVVKGQVDTRILCTYERIDDDTMTFEILAGTETPVSVTGNSVHEGEEITEVKTYPISGFQRAVLKRQK